MDILLKGSVFVVKKTRKTNAIDKSVSKPSFNARFSLEVGEEKAREQFMNRVENFIVRNFFDTDEVGKGTYRQRVLWQVANALGKRYGSPYYEFGDYVEGDFWSCLKALEASYTALPERRQKKYLAGTIQDIIDMSDVDLGIEWRNGAFWPSGAKLLDKDLINENLKWLAEHKYTSVLSPFEKGLRHFLEAHKKPEKLADAITDVYEALEALAKVMVGKDKDLSGNAELFIKKLGLSNHYKEMLKEYISYACDYRHAVSQGKKRVPPKHNEVEAFIYTTGLFIRLAIRQLE